MSRTHYSTLIYSFDTLNLGDKNLGFALEGCLCILKRVEIKNYCFGRTPMFKECYASRTEGGGRIGVGRGTLILYRIPIFGSMGP
jgi:hypothetical protein